MCARAYLSISSMTVVGTKKKNDTFAGRRHKSRNAINYYINSCIQSGEVNLHFFFDTTMDL